MPHEPLWSENGCFALVFINGMPDYVVTRQDAKRDGILCINTTEMEWQEGTTPALRFKPLREDPVTHDQTFLVGALPFWRENRAEVHPTVEEAFALHGEVLLGERGVMGPGGYFWRPPFVPHGPLLSKTGGLWLFRTKGGGLEIEYSEPPQWEKLIQDYLTATPLFSVRP
jgi:hypothetical protein